MLKLLSSQMAISLENARLYADLSNENRDRKKAEDALRENEKLWRSLFENTLVGISLTDTHGRYVAVNAAYQRMTGYSEAELVGLSPLVITHEEDRPASEAVLEAHALGRLHRVRLEKRFRTKTGEVVWTEVSASAVPAAGGTPLIAGFVRRHHRSETSRGGSATQRSLSCSGAADQPNRKLALERRDR